MTQITPIVSVRDLTASSRFFHDVLGLAVRIQQGRYLYLTRDNVSIRRITEPRDADMHDPKRQISCYIDVDDVDALYTERKANIDTLPKDRVRAPFNQPYGKRKLHVIDLDALLIFFGSAIECENT